MNHAAASSVPTPATEATAVNANRLTRVVLYADGDRQDATHALEQVLPLVKERAEVVAVCTDQSARLSAIDFDLLINFGGDGSILGAVRSMGANQVPVVGVNFGKIGFLATFELPDLLVQLDAILAGALPRRESIILDTTILRGSGETEKRIALNDAVISRGAVSRITRLRLSLDGAYTTTYHVDGLIVSSPVGSTAHSLSAGGPVLEPEIDGMIVAPICPHTLAVRPLMVLGRRQIEIEVVEAPEGAGVTFDGQEFTPVAEGDRLYVTAFEKRFTLIGADLSGFYGNLRLKLQWGGRIEPEQRRIRRGRQD